MLASNQPAEARAQATVKSILSSTPFSKKDASGVKKGKTVSTGLKEVSERELAAGAACLIKGDASGRLDAFRSEQRPLFKRSIMKAFGRLDPKDPSKSLEKLTLGEKAAEEAKQYLQFKPGFGLNLSAAEIEAFEALKAKPEDEGTVEKVHELIRRQLLERYTAFRQKGSSGIAEYAREKGSVTQPAQEQLATLEIAQGLQKLFPAYHRALLNYPADMPAGAEETFFWCRLRVDKRPVLVLAHRIDASFEKGEIIGERYFYCSRFCNAGFTVLALAPVKEGTLFLYGNRFWIDYWSGIPRLKHRFGQKVMSGSMEERMEREEICK